MTIAAATHYVYDFAEGSRDMRVVLGGKGANLAEMTRVLGPDLVPAGFTITTEACVRYMRDGRVDPPGLAAQVADGIARLEARAGRGLGDAEDPLLVSVRSGARDSMPGMLETILDLGLNDASVRGLAAQAGDDRFAWDSYRRFVQMFGNVVRGVPGERYEEILRAARRHAGVRADRGLSVGQLRDVTRRFVDLYEAHTGEPFPQDPAEQLRLAIRAVFDSWLGERAVHYRRINHIPDDWGTAVNVQQMVFGNMDLRARVIRAGDEVLAAGARIAIDGSTGMVTRDDVPLVEPSRSARFERVLAWADEFRRLGVRANADTPADALKALEHGAEGIGLCRTEHMFMAADRQPKMRAMIMARTEAERRAALAELLPLQQQDFEGLFAAMPGRPITIRLLDPPLHEFLPDPVELAQRVQRARDAHAPVPVALERELDLVLRLGEVNPMLGTRGCRLGIVHPEIYEMQVEAIMRAARVAPAPPRLEIMIPLVGFDAELAELRALVIRVGDRHGLREGDDYIVGTMIELPRACFVADRLAAEAEFFSFGTNDLTQTALGFSRDDVEAGFVPRYLERRILDRSPFESIDVDGVGALVETAVRLGRSRRDGIELGVCGEHGGDPDSIAFFHRAGLDYVSCSPYRLPIARVAAARAALEER